LVPLRSIGQGGEQIQAPAQLGDCFNHRRARYRLLTSLDAMADRF
jgi:hypothetical protein